MKKFTLTFTVFLICFFSEAQIVNLNPDPDGPPWISGGVDSWSAATQAHYDSIPQMSRISFINPPSAVDNSQNIFMRPIFYQEHSCCAQASGVGYVFTYEIRYLKN